MSDSLLAAGGYVSSEKAGTVRKTDTTKEEIERGVTIKSTCVTLYYDMAKFPAVDNSTLESDKSGKKQLLVNVRRRVSIFF